MCHDGSLGARREVAQCWNTGFRLERGERKPLGAFSPSFGGAVCEGCWREDRDSVRLEPDRIALLARLLDRDFGEPAEAAAAGEVTQALRLYAEYHLERPLRSLQLLATA